MACSSFSLLRPAFAALLLCASGAALPLPALAAPQTEQSQDQALAPQAKFIQDLGSQAISILADKTLTPDGRSEKFRQMLRESFDLPTVARFVIGRSWLAASPEQQKEYMDLYEALVVKTYSDRFALYTGEGFKVRDVTPESEKDTIVHSEITHPDGSAPTVVDWRVRKRGDKLGIIDVVVEGVSMSVTQRQEYASVIERNSGKIDALLDMMRERIQSKTKDSFSSKK